jgi:signal transduction histidine kinase
VSFRRRIPERLKPHSIRARVALAITAALALVFVMVQFVFGSIVGARAHAEVERTLRGQAKAIAAEIDRGGTTSAAGSAREAARFIGDTRMVVTVSGEVVYWNDPVSNLQASATAESGDVEVLLERPDPGPSSGDWLVLAMIIGGLAASGLVVWLLSGTIAERLRRSVSELADSAEAVTEGRLDVRVTESDDEMGRLGQAFNRMTERLEAADRRQREFLADVAHELRTPITAIEGFATALADGTARTEADRAESADFIRSEAARLRELVRELRELTWLDLDPPVRSDPIDLAAAARAAAIRLQVDAHVKGVELTGPEGVQPAVGDPEHVATILTNLVRNAINATSPGGSVELLTLAGDAEAGVEVRDTGRGIPPEHLPYIFDRMYRVDTARDRELGGSGLGLAIVRRLATLLGGRVTVTSEVGVGSSFTLWLPLEPVAAPRHAGVGSEPA